jgi:hypothetical protein
VTTQVVTTKRAIGFRRPIVLVEALLILESFFRNVDPSERIVVRGHELNGFTWHCKQLVSHAQEAALGLEKR